MLFAERKSFYQHFSNAPEKWICLSKEENIMILCENGTVQRNQVHYCTKRRKSFFKDTFLIFSSLLLQKQSGGEAGSRPNPSETLWWSFVSKNLQNKFITFIVCSQTGIRGVSVLSCSTEVNYPARRCQKALLSLLELINTCPW